MQIPLLHQQILLQTERLRDIHRSLMTHSTPVPAAEMEILLQEIRNLYNLALQLNNENALQLLNEVQLAVTQSLPASSKSVLQQSPEPTTVSEVKSEEIQKIKTENIVAEDLPPVTAKSDEPVAEKKRIVADIHEMFHDTPTLANKFSDHQTIAEKIAVNGTTTRISDQLRTPVKDIKAAIGINEKFQFINNLFNGDAKKYHTAVDQLNASPDGATAMNYIKDLSDSNNWESHAASAKSFIEIIERRFSV
jgi:hypothetical protein